MDMDLHRAVRRGVAQWARKHQINLPFDAGDELAENIVTLVETNINMLMDTHDTRRDAINECLSCIEEYKSSIDNEYHKAAAGNIYKRIQQING